MHKYTHQTFLWDTLTLKIMFKITKQPTIAGISISPYTKLVLFLKKFSLVIVFVQNPEDFYCCII